MVLRHECTQNTNNVKLKTNTQVSWVLRDSQRSLKSSLVVPASINILRKSSLRFNLLA